MVETSQGDQDLVFRNIQLHSHGRKESGSLHLTKHHFFFRYYPNAKKTNEAISGKRNSDVGIAQRKDRSGEDLDGSKTANESAPAANGGDGGVRSHQSVQNGPVSAQSSSTIRGTERPRNAERQKQRPVDMWIPYPMVNSCILRPSHSQGQPARFQTNETHISTEHDDRANDMFPPTFGTASYGRPSTDSSRLAPYSSPARPASPNSVFQDSAVNYESAKQPAIRIRLRDFRMMALHFYPNESARSPDETAREVFFLLRRRCCVDKVEDFHAFHFRPPKEETTTNATEYDARREYARMGISSKAADGPGGAWRITDINRDYSYSVTYPSVLCVPRTVSDNMLKYGGSFRSRSRIPCLSYLHSNGGSITRSSQPMVGLQNRRNPQDERLVSAIFSSHTPPLQPSEQTPQMPSLTSESTTTLESTAPDPAAPDGEVSALPISHSDTALDETINEKTTPAHKKVYGSTRRNLIIDARPKMNAMANRATGGGIEDVANYQGNAGMPVEKVFLNVANIHVMRSSLEKVVDAFANSDYIRMKPDQESLRKSAWLSHIEGMLEGAEMVARVIGLGGSHVLVHCSDGWDRTAQISALAQVMLDPYCRTLSGFISLVQKEFLSFGHKFRDRNGIEGSEKWFEIENERIAPSRKAETGNSDQTSLNTLGSKAFTGAKNWFEKNRGNLFKQQNSSHDSLTEQASSRPSSPPPNPLIHSSPKASNKEEREHRISEKEISPIFHQFLDAVFQLQNHYPNAFEFTERFLRRLFYHTYSCQYGEFLYNTEKERNQYRGKAPSVWSHFLSRRREFTNPDYVAKVDDPLLFPKRSGREIEVRWWNKLFGRDDEEMNVPRALAPPDLSAVTSSAGPTISFDERSAGEGDDIDTGTPLNGVVRESKSTSRLSAMSTDLSSSFSSMNMRSNSVQLDTKDGSAQPESMVPNTDAPPPDVDSAHPEASEAVVQRDTQTQPVAEEYDGDPLGVTGSVSKQAQRSGLDFAAFASQNAFRDR